MVSPHAIARTDRSATAFAAVAQAATLCAAQPTNSQAREVFRLVLRKLEAELGLQTTGLQLSVVR